MQKFKAVGVALVATLVVSAGAHAQEMRNFDNSWFWGFKSGINTFSAPGYGNTSTVDLGIDWLITRTTGGLYVSGNQSVFTKNVKVFDATARRNERTVQVKDLRRVTLAGVVFPKHFGGITPYGGIGYTIAVLGDARVFVDSADTFPNNAFLDEVEKRRSRSAVLGMAGVQIQTKRAAIFAQETMLPSNSSFLFNSVLSFFEFGVRYNFGSSIDR
jgi:phage protein U